VPSRAVGVRPPDFAILLASRWQGLLRSAALLFFGLAVGAAQAQGVHFDVELKTSNGPVAGSRLVTALFGDLGITVLPVDAVTGYKIFPGYFGDLEGGPYLTDDPGFQAFSGTFLRREEIHFRALGTLQHWDPASGRWAAAPADVKVTLFGGIPVEVIVGYTENPALWADLYNYYAAGTRYGSTALEGPPTALIDDAGSSGSFHAHLDWKITAASGEPPVGAYMVTLELWSPATQANGQAKYLPSEPIHVVFERGITAAQLQAAIQARVSPPPPPRCSPALLNWAVGASGCQASAPAADSGASVLLQDGTEPTLGNARFACVAGNWGSATEASCAPAPPKACLAQEQQWSVGGNMCTAPTPTTPSGDSATTEDTGLPTTGRATFVCDNGQWSAPTQASCTVPPPPAEPCAGRVLGWSVGAASCSAAVPSTASGGGVAAADTEGPTLGSALFVCTNGLWGLPTSASCAVPPPAACPATVASWAVAGNSCSAPLAQAESGTETSTEDTVLPLLGRARFACSNGVWSVPIEPSCAAPSPPPPRACSAQTLSWSVGARSCQANVAAAASGAEQSLLDSLSPAVGRARFACQDGQWQALATPAPSCGTLLLPQPRGQPRSPWGPPSRTPWHGP
jgi:hypothetical protein